MIDKLEQACPRPLSAAALTGCLRRVSRRGRRRAAATSIWWRRLGFRFQGVYYNHMIFKGKNRNSAWCPVLDEEWPEVRDRLETWLDPANFDDAGVARQSLFELMSVRSASRRGE